MKLSIVLLLAAWATTAACGGGGTNFFDKTNTASAGKPTAVAPAAATAANPGPTATTGPEPTPGPPGTETEGEQTVTVHLTEWKISGVGGAALGPIKAGEINFDVHNDGTTLHEFVVIRTDADPTSFPLVDGKVDEEAAGDSPGEADDIDAGTAKEATMRLQPGKYVFICNVPGHYSAGMRGELIVQ